MPIRLKDAKVGDYVRPPMKCQSLNGGLLMPFAAEFEVTFKDDRYVWLIERGKPVAKHYALGSVPQPGMFQCLGEDEFYRGSETRDLKTPVEKIVPFPEIQAKPKSKHQKKTVEFDFTDEDGALARLTPQAKTIADIMRAEAKRQKKSSFTEEELEKILNLTINKEKVGGKQLPYKVWVFYRSLFARIGLIRRT